MFKLYDRTGSVVPLPLFEACMQASAVVVVSLVLVNHSELLMCLYLIFQPAALSPSGGKAVRGVFFLGLI